MKLEQFLVFLADKTDRLVVLYLSVLTRALFRVGFWSGKRELNPPPLGPEPSGLPMTYSPEIALRNAIIISYSENLRSVAEGKNAYYAA